MRTQEKLLVFALSLFQILILVGRPSFASPPLKLRLSSNPSSSAVNRLDFRYSTARMARADTIKILALRAEFIVDDLATTNGNGRFDLSTSSGYVFDRPPHDSTYFQHQLLALANYFRRVSNGKVIIEGDVFPKGKTNAYQLSQNMVYYSGQENEELKKQRWAELLRDVLTVANTDPKPDFGKYDCFMIFHAGVGSDFAFDFDPTPYDIQSAFIDFTTLKETIGANDAGYQGIDVGDGVFVREGIILPETQNQEEQNLALLGTMTLLMGSQLGMPSLFDTQSGRPGIGRWGLMDQGSYNFQGLIPAEPSAWEKIFMGWEEPVVVTNAEGLRVGASNTTSAPHIVKVPIDSKEYFLMENRKQDRNGDKIAVGRDEQNKRVEFDSTGKIVAQSGMGVVTRIDEYDFGLPGSGILVWHIDERVIEANLATNTINDDREHRGVDLVECDGAQDIGFYYSLFDPAYGTESGDYFDPYWASNESHKIVNKSDVVELSPQSIPNSNANNRAVTHIRFANFSERDTVMTFSVSSDLAVPGFPQFVGSGFGAGSLVTFPMETGQGIGLIAVAQGGAILGCSGTGAKLIPNDDDLPLVAQTGDSVFLSPAMADFDNDRVPEVVVVERSGVLSLLSLKDADGDGRADVLGSYSISEFPTAGPMLMGQDGGNSVAAIIVGSGTGTVYLLSYRDDALQLIGRQNLAAEAITGLASMGTSSGELVAVTSNGDIFALNSAGEKLWQVQFVSDAKSYQPVVADFDGNAAVEIAVVSDRGDIALFAADGTLLSRHQQNPSLGPISAPSLGDVDEDGLPEILFSNGSQFFAFETSGASSLNFPIAIRSSHSLNTSEIPSPLWIKTATESIGLMADVDGMLHAFAGGSAKLVDGFPLTTGNAIVATPVLADFNQDADLELAVISTDGYLYAWNLALLISREGIQWPQFGGNERHDFSFPQNNTSTVSQATLMPSKKVFCYPNPTEADRTNIRYTLSKPASKVSIRLYDLAGDFVEELPSPEVSVGDHEVVWNVARIESGVYLARVEAVSGGDSSIEFIKIAVVK